MARDATSKSKRKLLRYTNLPQVLHILRTSSLTLVNPSRWEDKNDSHYMGRYKSRKNLKSLLALCFAQGEEAFHCWRTFTHGTDGACVVFGQEELSEAFGSETKILSGPVKYVGQKDHRAWEVDELPFRKRWVYRGESEFRIIYSDSVEEADARDFEIDLRSVNRIILNPWIPASVVPSVIASMKAINGCESIKVRQSSSLDSEPWKRLADHR